MNERQDTLRWPQNKYLWRQLGYVVSRNLTASDGSLRGLPTVLRRLRIDFARPATLVRNQQFTSVGTVNNI